MIDYRKFRLSKLNDPEFSHLKLLLFWPVFGLVFLIEERILHLNYTPMHCALDDKIPFCEFFLIPYLFWFVFLAGMGIYSFFFDIPAFRRFMRFIIVTYTITSVIYLLFPTMQTLRPMAFERDNVLTRFMAHYYAFDTNTNVCPSLHVIGSFAVLCASWKSRAFGTPAWRVAFSATAVLISVSTVFLKQHSALDIPPALAVSAIGWIATEVWERPRSAVRKLPERIS